MSKTEYSKAKLKGRNWIFFNVRPLLLIIMTSFSFFCQEKSANDDSLETLGALLTGNDSSITSSSVTSSNGPVLNDLTVKTFLSIGGVFDAQVVEVGFSLKNGPQPPVSVKAYIGHPNSLALDPNGLTAVNFMEEILNPNPLSPDRFTFLSPNISGTFKVIVIASNTFGKSSKEIISTPPPPIPLECDGAVSAPSTVGNCSGHCIEVSVNGKLLEITAKDTTTALQDVFYLDSSISRPSGVPISFDFMELGINIGLGATVPIDSYSLPNTTFDTQNYDRACVVISSYRYFDSAAGYFDSNITKKILVP